MSAWAVERMTEEGWERVRAIRLRALADAPDAFGTTLVEEEATTPERWQERLGACRSSGLLRPPILSLRAVSVGNPVLNVALPRLRRDFLRPTALASVSAPSRRPHSDRLLARPTDATFVATRGGRDVGLVVGGLYDGRREDAGLYAMWVAPEARSQGIGGALVDAVVAWARGEGRSRIVLDVADGNTAAVRLYESRGFPRTGVTGTLPPPREHILEHQRALELRPPG